MKPLALALVPVLVFLLGVPILVITMGAIVVTPAVAEQIRIDPCSAYPDQTNVTAAGAEEGGLGFELPKWGNPRHQSLTSPAQSIPGRIKALYVAAAERYKIPWELLAGIGMAETRHGRDNATSSAGAQGLMQFMPRTFAAYGVDGNRDGRRNIHNDADSIYSAGNYLTKSGVTNGQKGVIRALWAYNHSVSYRNDVLYYAWAYARGGDVVVVGEQEDCGYWAGGGDPTLPPLTSERSSRPCSRGDASNAASRTCSAPTDPIVGTAPASFAACSDISASGCRARRNPNGSGPARTATASNPRTPVPAISCSPTPGADPTGSGTSWSSTTPPATGASRPAAGAWASTTTPTSPTTTSTRSGA